MTAYLPNMECERRNPALSQWYTPPVLASRVWDWANRHERPTSVLEPAAGQGALIKPIIAKPYDCKAVVAIDIDPSNRGILDIITRGKRLWTVWQGDFLQLYRQAELPKECLLDLGLMNPPYEDGQAEAFVLHALTVCTRVVGIFKASILHGQERHKTFWSKAHVTREVRLMSRPKFGRGAKSDSAMSDFVVLEIVRGAAPVPHRIELEMWP